MRLYNACKKMTTFLSRYIGGSYSPIIYKRLLVTKCTTGYKIQCQVIITSIGREIVQELLKWCNMHTKIRLLSRLGKSQYHTILTLEFNLYTLEVPYSPTIYFKCYSQTQDLRELQISERLPVNKNGRRNIVQGCELVPCRHHP